MVDTASKDFNQPAKSYSYGRSAFLNQAFATFVISLTFFGNGMFAGIPTVIVGHLLNSENDALSLNEEQASWFGALPFLLQPIGASLGVLLQDFYSQKHSLNVSHTLAVVFYSVLFFATSISTVLFSGVIMGLCQGFTQPSTMSFISEFSEVRLRGIMSSGAFSMMSIGLLFEFIVVSLVEWRTLLLFNAAVHLTALSLLPWVPASPIWLLSKTRKKKALKSLAWFRGCRMQDHVLEEFHDMDAYVKSSLLQSHIVVERHDEGEQPAKPNFVQKFRSNMSELLLSIMERRTLYPLFLISCISMTHCFAGSIGGRIYAMNLFDSLKTSLNRNWVTLASSSANVAGSMTVLVFLKYTGKRKLAIGSFILASIMSITLGVYVHYKDCIQEPWVFFPLFVLMVYVTSQGVSIPWLLIGEVFPVRTRNAGAGLFGVVFDFLLFFFLKTYFTMDRIVGTDWYFIIHGTIGLTGCIFLYRYIPETEGKSLAEIEKIFLKK